jgi:hypothetical protein
MVTIKKTRGVAIIAIIATGLENRIFVKTIL